MKYNNYVILFENNTHSIAFSNTNVKYFTQCENIYYTSNERFHE